MLEYSESIECLMFQSALSDYIICVLIIIIFNNRV